jgi:mRNA-degrading endonuclease RelE of RelBE toxin-antitoxin system
VSYQIEVVIEARKEVSKLPGNIRAQARQQFLSLATNPRPPKMQELRGKPGYYRIWLAGRWRIVYTIDDNLQLVTILRVRRKEDIDYEGV